MSSVSASPRTRPEQDTLQGVFAAALLALFLALPAAISSLTSSDASLATPHEEAGRASVAQQSTPLAPTRALAGIR